MRTRAAAWLARSTTMLKELDSRREETATVRLLWDDLTEIVWLHVQEDTGAEHVAGVPADEARDAFLSPALYVDPALAVGAGGSARERG